jgi:hypothetical protein
MLKRCSCCKKEKEVSNFLERGAYFGTNRIKYDSICHACYADKRRKARRKLREDKRCTDCKKSSVTYRCPSCQDLHIKANNKRRQIKKQKLVEDKGSLCAHCGLVSDIAEVYDFHHQDGIKEDTLSNLLNKRGSLDLLFKETEGCILLCGNCHHKLHFPDITNMESLNSSRSSRLKKKIKAIDYKGGVCSRCSAVVADSAFVFHHLDPKIKKYNPARVFQYSWEIIQEELDNCILLCDNCHRILHYEIDNKVEK